MPQIVVLKTSRRILGEVQVCGNFIIVTGPSIYDHFKNVFAAATFEGSAPLGKITIPLQQVEMILEAKEP